MRLVEVIPTIDTDPGFVEAVEKTMVAIGKAPIRVKDVVGFAVNRLLHALVIESIRLVEEGVCSPAEIDTACKLGLGHPIGPFELLDNTQNSLSLSITKFFIRPMASVFCRARGSASSLQPATTAARRGAAGTVMTAMASGCET